MPVMTDNPAEVGKHVFERAGLGIAPFRCVGFSTKIFKAAPDAPAQPGTCCDYCGTGIMLVCEIQGADGKRFKVGSDCVAKTGDAGLIKGYKNTPEYRKHQRDLTQAKNARKHAEITALLQSPAVQALLAAERHPRADHAEFFATKTMLDWATWMMKHAGAEGRDSVLRRIKRLQAERSTP